jgi:uncharacterized protein (TIGR02996 family)
MDDNPLKPTEEEALLRAVLAAPEDDALRSVYADWLEERGDPRGKVMRAWLALLEASQAFFHAFLEEPSAAPFQFLGRQAEHFRAQVRQANRAWLVRLGQPRPWVGRELALQLVRLWLSERRKNWVRLDEGRIDEVESAWLMYHGPRPLPWQQTSEGFQRCYLVHKLFAIVRPVGPHGVKGTLSRLEKSIRR